MVEDIKASAKGKKWSFDLCCREKNRVAHCLASNCLNRRSVLCLGCIPLDLEIPLAKNVNPDCG